MARSCVGATAAQMDSSSGGGYFTYPFTMHIRCRRVASASTANAGIFTMQLDANARQHTINYKNNSSQNKWGCFSYDLTTFHQAESSSTTVLNEWVSLVATFPSSSSRTIYVDNANSGTDSGSAGAISGSGILRIVLTGGAGRLFEFCDAAVWDVELGSSDRAMLALGVSPRMVRTANILRHIPMIGRSDTEQEIFGGYSLVPDVSDDAPFVDNPNLILPSAQILQFPPVAAGGGVTIPVFNKHYRNQGMM